MSNYSWRQGYGIDPIREVMRRFLPGIDGNSGFVISDIDYLFRRYGPLYNLDQNGDLMFMEKKEYSGIPGYREKNIHEWLNRELKGAGLKYRGIHILTVPEYKLSPNICPVCAQPAFNLCRLKDYLIEHPQLFVDIQTKQLGVINMGKDWASDNAYKIGLSAKLLFNNQEITWEKLNSILLGEINGNHKTIRDQMGSLDLSKDQMEHGNHRTIRRCP